MNWTQTTSRGLDFLSMPGVRVLPTTGVYSRELQSTVRIRIRSGLPVLLHNTGN